MVMAALLLPAMGLAAFIGPTDAGVMKPLQRGTHLRHHMSVSSRRTACGLGLWIASGGLVPRPALARPEGVNKPELLPPGPMVRVIDLERFLTSGQVKAMEKKLEELERATGIK